MIRSLEGKTPKVHPSAFISEAAYVVGDVEIGENSSVWPGAVIRADNGKVVVGSNTNIQDNSVIHSDSSATIGSGVTIGHNVLWHGRYLADNCLVGNGATVNEGVEVGELSIVGSGSVVLDGMKIPERTVVTGVPARPRSEIEERHEELIRTRAISYAKRAKVYKDNGLESE